MRIAIFFLIVIQLTLIKLEVKGQDLDTVKKNIDMPEIQVTRTKDNNVSKMPLSLSVIESENISFDGNNTLDNILSKQIGVMITTTPTGNQGMQLQGLDASYLTVLVDGIPLIGRTFGELDLRRIILSNVEKIEILKGASSSLYGSDALSGVVNIITKSTTNNGTNIDLNVNMGSNYTINPSVMHQYKNNNFQISSSLDYHQTNGYDLVDDDFLNTVNPYQSYTIFSKLQYIITNRLSINGKIRYYDQDQIHTDIYSSQLGETKFLEGKRKISDYNIGGSLKYEFNPQIYQEAEFYTTKYNTEEFLLNQDESVFEESISNHNLLHFESRTYYSKNKINFILGLGTRQEEVKREEFVKFVQQDLQFAYLQIDTDIFSKMRLITGIRYDNYSDDRISKLSHKFAIGIPITKSIYLNGSIGTGFKMPDFRQRYFNFTNSTQGGYTVLGREIAFDRLTSMMDNGMISNFHIPLSELNTSLQPEESININLGLSYQYKKIDVGLNIFNNKIINLIDYQLVADYEDKPAGVYTYFNVNEVETKGIELNVSYQATNQWRIKTGYQLLYAYDVDIRDSFANNEMYARDDKTLKSFRLNRDDYFGLFNRSRHTGNLSFLYNMNKKMQFNSIISYRTKYGLEQDDNGNDILDKYDNFVKGHALCDIGIRYHLPFTSLHLGVKNIFGFTNPEFIPNISGRFYYINLLFNLIKT